MGKGSSRCPLVAVNLTEVKNLANVAFNFAPRFSCHTYYVLLSIAIQVVALCAVSFGSFARIH